MEIQVTNHFVKQYQKLPSVIKTQAKQKELVFRINPFDSRLKTHQLVGKEKECWSFSVNYEYRIKFIFLTKTVVLFLEIGTHSIYR